MRAHSRAVPRLECTALGAGKVGWERTPPRRLCGLRWLPRQTVLRAQRQNEFEEPVGMDSRVPPLGTAASGGTWPWSGRGGEVHPKRKDPTPLREPIAVPDANATAEARFLLSDLCVLVHARRRRMRNECRISLDALNFFNCLSCSFPKQPLGFCRGNQCYLEARLGTSWPSLFLGVGESAPGAESCDPKAGRSRESQWPHLPGFLPRDWRGERGSPDSRRNLSVSPAAAAPNHSVSSPRNLSAQQEN